MKEKVKAYFASLAVEGIQKYIFSTGRLKEMIGGSEIINFITREEFFKDSLPGLEIIAAEKFTGQPGTCVICQANAGALRLVFAEKEAAKAFLSSMSERLLALYPGLPFYGALCEFDWSDDKAGKDAYMAARREAEGIIAKGRNERQPAEGCSLLPILSAAPLDGRPSVVKRDERWLSLPSLARSAQELIDRSRGRLRVKAPDGIKVEWKDNLEEMLGGQGGKVALICMDGNDLGKLFGTRLEDGSSDSPAANIRVMTELSNTIEQCNRQAFDHACSSLVRKLAPGGKYADAAGNFVMPLRPIVLGGDDVTIIARAEIALPFALLFTKEFEKAAREKGLSLSLGTGMVVMDSSYPFVKAFPLAESLQDSAKNLTRHLPPNARPSSLDYLVLTEDVEDDEALVRQRLYTGSDGSRLTIRPFSLGGGEFMEFLENGGKVNNELPRSQLRQAWTLCRAGCAEARVAWENLRENIARGLGGRHGKLMKKEAFEQIFPNSFFQECSDAAGKNAFRTALGDYLELAHLMPDDGIFDLVKEACANA